MKRLPLLLLSFILALVSPPSAQALDLWPFDDGISFNVRIHGVPDELAKEFRLEELARQAIDKENPPEDLGALNINSGLMAGRMEKAMRSNAYYDASVSASITENEGATPIVVFEVIPGERYTIASNKIKWLSEPAPLAGEEALYLENGIYADAATILEANKIIKTALNTDSCYLSLTVEPRLILDKTVSTADVQYQVTHGPPANFGQTHFIGETEVSTDVLRRHIKWEQGECFNEDKINSTQTALLKSQLLASAQITVADTPNEQGEVPITIDVTDRPHRTVTAGASYGSDEGAGVTAGWEHRNLYNRAHKFSVKTTVAQLEYAVEGLYTIPYFYHDQQKLNVSGSIKQENTDTFDSSSISFLVALDRKLTNDLLVGIGGGARFSRIDEAGEPTQNFGLIYFPVYAEWENRDNVLDPTRGVYARASIAPYTDVTGQGVSFLKTEGVAQTYLTAKSLPLTPTLALRGAYGQINGASTRNIPADLRFYAGGGGSVRGYNFRAIGPQDNGEPEGGTTWTELSAEARLRFTEEFGGVVFVDAGTVTPNTRPNLSEKLFLSTGVGVRYFSAIGPIRLDVGIPLDEVADDAAFGVYVSIGQAF